MKSDWKLVENYPVVQYKCGLAAGDHIRLKCDIHVKDHKDKPTGEVHRAGEIWTVIRGAADENPVLWLLQPDGKRHTWDDNVSVFETFAKV